jgi:hypothetical protein
MEEYNFKFDKNNSNTLLIYKENKLINMIALPNVEKGCDIINFSKKLCDGYTFNTNALILITSKNDRKIYYKGDLIAETNRNYEK